MKTTDLASPRLLSLAAAARAAPAAAQASGKIEVARAEATADTAPAACDLCGEPIGARHGHMVDVAERALLCSCRPCSILFERPGAGGHRYRLVPDRVVELEDFAMDDMDWLALRVPVDLAFFFRSSAADRIVALYPGPMGATESLLALEHWKRLEARNGALAGMEPDVEALLVDRRKSRRHGWIVPIDACYELVAVFRTRWKGLAGGPEVQQALTAFFEDLARRASSPGRAPRPDPPRLTPTEDHPT